MNRRALSTLPVLPILLWGCFGERSAGTSTETENAIGARLVRVDSVFSPMEAYPGETAVATLRLDSTSVDFPRTRPDGQDLEVVRQDGKAIPFELSFWDREHSRGRLLVRLEPQMRYHGSYFLLRWGLPPAVRQSSEEVWAGIGESRKLAWNSVLVDHFESGTTLRNTLPDSSFWFFSSVATGSGLTSSGSGRSGSSLHLVCQTGQCDSAPTLLSATQISRDRRSLRGLDSIELWVRGSGTLFVTFESLDSIQMGRMSRGRIDSIQSLRSLAPHVAGPSWERVVVRPGDFLGRDGTARNVGWDGVRDSINYLSFLIQGGNEVWIDDVRFHGILGQDLR